MKPRVLKPNIISNIISKTSIEKIIDQKPKIKLSNSDWYLFTIFFKTITNTIISNILKTLGKEINGSKLKKRFINKDKKKRIKSLKILSFTKKKFLLKKRSNIKIKKIRNKVKFIDKFPKIKLIGKKEIRIK